MSTVSTGLTLGLLFLPTQILRVIVRPSLAALLALVTGQHYFSRVETSGEEKCIPVTVLSTVGSYSLVFSTGDIFLCLNQEATKDSAGIPKHFFII